jgi:VanZ family protein
MKNWFKQDKRIFVWMPTLVWAFVIFVFSVLPFKGPNLVPSNSDKIYHFFEYLLFAVLLTRSLFLELEKLFPITVCLFALILAGTYGILMELVQVFVPGRYPSLADVLSNLGGIIVGILIGKYLLWQKLDRSEG